MPLTLRSPAEVFIEETAHVVLQQGRDDGVFLEFATHSDFIEEERRSALVLGMRLRVGEDDEQLSAYIEGIDELEALRDLLSLSIEQFKRNNPQA